MRSEVRIRGRKTENLRSKAGYLELEIPAKNEGKYRFKRRATNFTFGESFSARTELFNDEIYLEWQIGYDAIVIDVENGKKETMYKEKTFIGSNRKKKYIYELSEIIYMAKKAGLLNTDKIEEMQKEINKYNDFMDKDIVVEAGKDATINGVVFKEAVIKLPTYFFTGTTDGTQVEISMEKQQYAAGIQPMIYFCIPVKSFDNHKKFIGKSSTGNDALIYKINKNSINNFLLTMKIFGMASERHKHDVAEILKIIKGAI